MGDEFRCFLDALFAWYVGPLACKGIVTIVRLIKQDFEWMSRNNRESEKQPSEPRI